MFEKLIKRLLSNITILNSAKNLFLLIDGLSIELYRVIDFANRIKSSVVPNKYMDPESIYDYNEMLGIPNSISGTNDEKIARIIEKSDITGFPGKDWLQDQVRNAGYDLYVIEQEILPVNILQWGDFQFEADIQFGLTSRFLDPANVPGILIVNQPYGGLGRIYSTQYAPAVLDVYSSQYGDIQYGLNEYGTITETIITQYGTSGFQYGTPNMDYVYPRPREYKINELAVGRFGFYFFLSPFPDRLANQSELLNISVDEYIYLRKLVIVSKLVRSWCIAQVSVI